MQFIVGAWHVRQHRGTYLQLHEAMQQMNQTQTINTQTATVSDELAKMKYFDSGQ